MGGTCTGEHGVGEGKIKYMAEEHGESGLAVMRRIKAALDPGGIFNPGKVIDMAPLS
jgi:D-lactate dehydrogenase (cytochrome)